MSATMGEQSPRREGRLERGHRRGVTKGDWELPKKRQGSYVGIDVWEKNDGKGTGRERRQESTS